MPALRVAAKTAAHFVAWLADIRDISFAPLRVIDRFGSNARVFHYVRDSYSPAVSAYEKKTVKPAIPIAASTHNDHPAGAINACAILAISVFLAACQPEAPRGFQG